MVCKAVIFDYIGTLVNCKNYSMDASREKLYLALLDSGFKLEKKAFLQQYIRAHEKYQIIRFEQNIEVTNAVWVAEALNNLGYKVTADDSKVKLALNLFFKDYVDTLTLKPDAKKLIKYAKENFKIGLVSNFTFSPVIYASLRQFRLNSYFDAVVVSHEIGWRKPSNRIFSAALNKLQITPQEAVYIGDSPIDDIKGAKAAGLKTVFVPSQFNSKADLLQSQQKPDFIVEDLADFNVRLKEIIGE